MCDWPSIVLALVAVVVPLACAWWLIGRPWTRAGMTVAPRH